MLQDVSLMVGKHLFNYRVAAIIRLQDKVLVNQLVGQDFWFLPGGRVQEGESSVTALERELREEIAAVCRVHRPVFLHENFFTHDSSRFHELCLYYDVELSSDSVTTDSVTTFEDIVPADRGIELRWVSTLQLAGINLQPPFLSSRLEALPSTLEHVVSRR